MSEKLINNDFVTFFTRVLLPAIIAVGMKIAIEVKILKTKVTLFNIFLSMFVGLGMAYLSSDLVMNNFEKEQVSLVFALIAITSEKIVAYLILKMNVDAFMSAILNMVFDTILKHRKDD